jgi:hypothetical protein
VAWGYIARPNISENLRIVTHVVAFAVPTSFLVGVVGIVALCGSRIGVLGWTGVVLAASGLGLAAAANIVEVEPLRYGYFAETEGG